MEKKFNHSCLSYFSSVQVKLEFVFDMFELHNMFKQQELVKRFMPWN